MRKYSLGGFVTPKVRIQKVVEVREIVFSGDGAETETDEQAVVVNEGQDAVAPEASVKEREAELARREDQLCQRERALTQKWTQFLSAKCPNCGRPVATPEAAAG